jgi:hypothetical protein
MSKALRGWSWAVLLTLSGGACGAEKMNGGADAAARSGCATELDCTPEGGLPDSARPADGGTPDAVEDDAVEDATSSSSPDAAGNAPDTGADGTADVGTGCDAAPGDQCSATCQCSCTGTSCSSYCAGQGKNATGCVAGNIGPAKCLCD